jgi:putative ABC transport system permease protein
MNTVWRRVILRRLIEEPARTLLTVLGVALGVAMFVSIRLASSSALASFGDTVDAVAGKANLEISASSEGLDERVFPALRKAAGVRAAAPVVEAYLRARAGGTPSTRASVPLDDWPETVLLLGLDPLSEGPFERLRIPPDSSRAATLALMADRRAAAVPSGFAARHGLRLGDTLTVLASGRPEPLVVRRLLDTPELEHAFGGNVAIVDIATAQEVLHRFGRIDRVDLVVDPRARDAARAALSRLLPTDARVDAPRGRTRQVESMVSAFALNLSALSFIALFVATFLIFNAVATSVLRWRREIGVLRALGVTRRGITALFLAEGLGFGVVGGALGLVLGTWMARGALRLVSRTLTDLYLVHQASTLHPDRGVYALGFALGPIAAAVAALAPAIEAARTPPGVTMRQGLLIEAERVPLGRWTVAGLLGLLAALAVSAWTVREGRPAGGFVSAGLALIGFSLCAPGSTRMVGWALAAPSRGLAGVAGTLGIRYLRVAVARTGAAVAALMVAVGMLVALDVMVSSFRRTVDAWVGQTIRGDLYVEPVGHRENFGATSLPESLVARVRALPGVTGVDTFRGTRILYGERPAFAAGVDLGVQSRLGNLQFVHGRARELLTAARTHDGVVVSESFASHHHVNAGDRIALATPSGIARLPVLGVYYDYTTDAGGVLMDATLFERLWRTRRIESLAVYAAPGVSVDALRAAVLAAAGHDLVLNATPNRELRARALQVFDQTFQITFALQAIAILVAVLGVASTLTALILQRGREIAVLRAVGAERSQVHRMVVVESVAIGVSGAALGCVCGLALAMILIHVINRQYFGWTIRTHLEARVFLGALGLMVASAALAGIAPARLAATRVAAEAMRMD